MDDENGIERDRNGRFVKGGPGGPGRPKWSIDIIKLAKERAREQGTSIEEVLGEILDAMVAQARAGDVAAGKMIFDRLLGPVDRGPLAIAVSGSSGPLEPWVERPGLCYVPEPQAYTRQLVARAIELGLVPQDIVPTGLLDHNGSDPSNGSPSDSGLRALPSPDTDELSGEEPEG